jgi:hypothetical protein
MLTTMNLEGWNHAPQGFGATFDTDAAPGWLRAVVSTPSLIVSDIPSWYSVDSGTSRRIPTSPLIPWSKPTRSGQVGTSSHTDGGIARTVGPGTEDGPCGQGVDGRSENTRSARTANRTQTRSPTPTIASATVRKLAWLLRACPRIS